MAFKGVDHVVVRVSDLDSAVEGYRKLLDIDPELKHSDELQADQAFFYFENDTFLELISPIDDTSPIARSLAKLGEGIHTVAFAVDDQKATIADLDAKGLRTLGGTFVHPSAANGVVVQLSERS